MSRPPHHRPGGRFRNPWLQPGEGEHGFGDVVRWAWQRRTRGLPPDPPPEALPLGRPEVAYPHADPAELRITWIGHATALVQIGGLNVLTDPMWSRRASPVQWAGPARLVPPALPFEALPPIDAVIVSHDHYDHLDAPTVERLHERFGERIRWIAPLGYDEWFRDHGVSGVVELDWGQEATLGDGRLRVRATPAQHWTRREPFGANRRLWASWVLDAPGGHRVFFAGDTAYFAGLAEIGRLGPFDALLLPIGAYEPRWFMKPVHMNPEEAVRAYGEMGGRGVLMGIHWSTFRLTDEPVLEPPERVRAAWEAAGYSPSELAVSGPGRTLVLPAAGDVPEPGAAMGE